MDDGAAGFAGATPAVGRASRLDVLFLARNMQIGGAERQLLMLAAGLHRAGHRVRVALFYPSGPLLEPLQATGVEVISLGKSSRWDVLGFSWRLARLAWRVKPDLIHGYTDAPNIFLALLRPFLPARTSVVWGFRASSMAGAHDNWVTRLNTWLVPLLSRGARAIIANSKEGANYLEARGIRAAVTVIPNGIDTAHYAPDPVARKRLRQDWGVADGTPLIGIMARMVPKKDHALFLESAAELQRRGTQARFVCIGDGSSADVAKLKRMADELGLGDAVLWPGTRNDTADVYNALDVLCLTSSCGEGFPNVLGEAMSCGTACATMDVGDAALVLGEVGGAVVTSRNPAAFADGVMCALSRSNDADKAARRMRVEKFFSVDRLVASTAGTLQALAAPALLNNASYRVAEG